MQFQNISDLTNSKELVSDKKNDVIRTKFMVIIRRKNLLKYMDSRIGLSINVFNLFYTAGLSLNPWKISEKQRFLVFSGDMKRNQWQEMGYINVSYLFTAISLTEQSNQQFQFAS